MDGIGLLVWDLNAKLLFSVRPVSNVPFAMTDLLNRHNHFHSVEAVEAEVVVEVRLAIELVYIS